MDTMQLHPTVIQTHIAHRLNHTDPASSSRSAYSSYLKPLPSSSLPMPPMEADSKGKKRQRPNNAPGHSSGNPGVKFIVRPPSNVQAGVFLDPPPVISVVEDLGNSYKVHSVTAKAVDIVVASGLESEAKAKHTPTRRRGSLAKERPLPPLPSPPEIPSSDLLQGDTYQEVQQLLDGKGKSGDQRKWYAAFGNLYFAPQTLGQYAKSFRLEFWVHGLDTETNEPFLSRIISLPTITVHDSYPESRDVVAQKEAYMLGRMAAYGLHNIAPDYIPPGYFRGYQAWLGDSGNITPDITIQAAYDAEKTRVLADLAAQERAAAQTTQTTVPAPLNSLIYGQGFSALNSTMHGHVSEYLSGNDAAFYGQTSGGSSANPSAPSNLEDEDQHGDPYGSLQSKGGESKSAGKRKAHSGRKHRRHRRGT